MGAGPVPEILHRTLNLLAKARAALRLPPLTPLSRLFYAVLNRTRFSEHRGGMFVQARGVADGRPIAWSWHLLAEGNDGPYIPSMAIEAIVRKLLAGVLANQINHQTPSWLFDASGDNNSCFVLAAVRVGSRTSVDRSGQKQAKRTIFWLV